MIKTRWRTLPDAQRGGIKDFVVNMVIQRSSSEESLRADKFFMNKLNVILVQVVKQEWPHNWPSFISDLVTAAKTSESLCENNLLILKLLSEEVPPRHHRCRRLWRHRRARRRAPAPPLPPPPPPPPFLRRCRRRRRVAPAARARRPPPSRAAPRPRSPMAPAGSPSRAAAARSSTTRATR